MGMKLWQAKYWTAAAVLLPVSPLLYLQGQLTRQRVGTLPYPSGDNFGISGNGGGEPARMLAIGESTIAGLGAATHEFAFAGQFAKLLSRETARPISWHVVGKNGVTARRTIEELVPHIPDEKFDYILVGLGGNDVLKLSSPKKWRRDMTELLSILRGRFPDAVMFLSNCPMIKLSPAIPHPIRFFLWELSKMHDANTREFTREMERVFYYHQPRTLDVEGFFADGIHPSEKGYADWSAAMMEFFRANHRW